VNVIVHQGQLDAFFKMQLTKSLTLLPSCCSLNIHESSLHIQLDNKKFPKEKLNNGMLAKYRNKMDKPSNHPRTHWSQSGFCVYRDLHLPKVIWKYFLLCISTENKM